MTWECPTCGEFLAGEPKPEHMEGYERRKALEEVLENWKAVWALRKSGEQFQALHRFNNWLREQIGGENE